MTTTVYIPTRQRVGHQETWSWLPDAVRERTYLVCPEEEAEALDMLGYNVLVRPVSGIANVRQWIIDQHDVATQGEVALMLDDDLKFAQRRVDDPGKFTKPAKGSPEIQAMFDAFDHMMQYVPLGGLADRSGANRVTEPYRMNSRTFAAWGLNVPLTRRLGIKVNRLPFMADFDTVLQFLARGYATLSLNTYVKDDAGSNASGGCSVTRDGTDLELAAMQLAKLWPEYVTLVERPGWRGMGDTRTDVRVAWQKAYKAGREDREMLGLPPVPEPTWATGVLTTK